MGAPSALIYLLLLRLIAGDQAGYRWPGYLSDGTFGGEPIKFSDMPGGTLASAARALFQIRFKFVLPSFDMMASKKRKNISVLPKIHIRFVRK